MSSSALPVEVRNYLTSARNIKSVPIPQGSSLRSKILKTARQIGLSDGEIKRRGHLTLRERDQILQSYNK